MAVLVPLAAAPGPPSTEKGLQLQVAGPIQVLASEVPASKHPGIPYSMSDDLGEDVGIFPGTPLDPRQRKEKGCQEAEL